jgi:hypothetical protein
MERLSLNNKVDAVRICVLLKLSSINKIAGLSSRTCTKCREVVQFLSIIGSRLFLCHCTMVAPGNKTVLFALPLSKQLHHTNKKTIRTIIFLMKSSNRFERFAGVTNGKVLIRVEKCVFGSSQQTRHPRGFTLADPFIGDGRIGLKKKP